LKGYRLIQINSLADLENAELDFWVTDLGYDLEDVKGSYTEAGEEVEFEPIEKVKVSFSINVHNKVFTEAAEVWKAKDHNLYITEEELEKHC